MNPLVFDFYFDVQVALEVYDELDKNFAPARKLLELIEDSMSLVDLQNKFAPPYYGSLKNAQKKLRAGMKDYEHSFGMGKLVLAGHAHIDTAWLWPLRQFLKGCQPL